MGRLPALAVLVVSLPVLTAHAAPEDPPISILVDLTSPDAALRASALARAVDQPLLLDPLLGALDDATESVREAAAAALGRFGVPGQPERLTRLLAALQRAARDPSPPVARSAIRALARYPFPEVQAELRRIAEDARVPAEARAEVAKSAPRGPSPELRARLDAWLRVLSRSEPTNLAAALGPRCARDSAAPCTLAVAAARLLSSTPSAWSDAAAELVALPDDQALPFLLFALRTRAGARSEVGSVVAERLGRVTPRGQAAVLEALLAAASHPTDAVRASAAHALVAQLAGLGAPWVSRVLDLHAAEARPAVRERLLAALVAASRQAVLDAILARPLPPPATLSLLWPLALDEASPSAAELLVRTLLETRNTALADRVEARLGERDDLLEPLLRHAASSPRRALRALERFGDARVSRRALELVDRGHAEPAAFRLIRRDPALEPALLALLAHAAPEVRAGALAAVDDAHGEPFDTALHDAILTHPDDDALVSRLLRPPGQERVGGLLRLLREPRARSLWPRLVGALDDARAPELADTMVGVVDEPACAAGAIDVLTRLDDADAIPALAQLVDRPGLPTRLRERAVERIAQAEAPDPAIAALARLAQVEDRGLRTRVRGALHTLAPATYPAWDPYGRIPLVASAAAFGGSILLLASDVSEARLSPAFTIGAGLVLGGATPFLMTLDETVSLGDAAFFTTQSAWGTALGVGLGDLAEVDVRATRGLTLIGQVTGVAAGALAMSSASWSLDDALLSNLVSAQTGLVAGSFAALDGRRAPGGVGLIAGAAASIPMAWLARELHVRGELELPLTFMAHGAVLGALAPGIIGASGLSARDAALGALAGQGLGFLLGLGTATLTDVPPERLAWGTTGALLGAAIGGGLALRDDTLAPRARFGLLAGSGAALGLGFGLLGERLELTPIDASLVAMSTAAGLGLALGGRTTLENAGGDALLGGGAGALTGLLLGHLVDPSPEGLIRSSAGGALLGGATLALTHLLRTEGPTQRVASIGAAVLGTFALAPLAAELDLGPRPLVLASIVSISAGAWGLALPGYFDRSPTGVDTGSGFALGAGLGFAGGVALAQVLPLPEGAPLRAAVGSSLGLGLGLGLGLLAPDASGPLRAGFLQGAGALGLGLGLVATQLELRSGTEPVPLAASLALQGSLHGVLLAPTWRGDGVRPAELAGGALTGASLGAAAGFVLERLGGVSVAPDRLAEATIYGLIGHALGGGVGLLTNDARVAAFTMHGASALGYGLGLFLGDRTEYGLSALSTAYLMAAMGAQIGAWAALVPDAARGREAGGGALVGAAAGAGLGVAYAQLVPESSPLELAGFSGSGVALGFGLQLLWPESRRAPRAWAASLSSAGALTLGMLASPFTRYDLGDGALIAGMGLLGVTHGGLLGAAHDGSGKDLGALAGGLIGGSLGTLSGIALSQAVSTTPGDVARAGVVAESVGAIGLGLSNLFGATRAQGQGLVHPLALGLGLAISPLVAPHLLDRPEDLGPLAIGVGALSLEGARFARVLAPGEEGSGVLLGAGLGVLAGTALGELYPMSGADVLETAVFASITRAGAASLSSLVAPTDAGAGLALEAALGLVSLGSAMAFAPHTSWSGEQVALTSGLMLLGAGQGMLTSATLGTGPLDDTRAGPSALVGATAGLWTGFAASHLATYTGEDLAEIAAGAALGYGLGGGLSLLIDSPDPRVRTGLIAGVGLATLAGSLALAPSIELDAEGLRTGALFASIGGALAMPSAVYAHGGRIEDVPTRALTGGAIVGAGLSLGVGALASAWAPIDAERREAIAFGAATGALTGLGLGLAISPDDRAGVAMAQGLGVLGAALIGATAEPRALNGSDLLLGATWTAYLGWHQLGATLLLSGTDRQALGFALATTGLGAVSATYLFPRLKPRGDQALMLLAGSVWGSWIGGWGGQMLRDGLALDDRQGAGLLLTSSVLGSDVGLGLAGLVTSGLVDMEPLRFAVINLAGVGGMLSGMLVAGFARGEPLREGNVIGSLAGLALGTLVTGFIDFGRKASPYDPPPAEEEPRASSGASPAFTLRQWMPSAGVEPGPTGEPRYMLSVSGTFD